MYKECNECKIKQEILNFYNCSQCKDGKVGRCKFCYSKKNSEIYKKNSDIIKLRTKKYAKENSIKIKEYREKNKKRFNRYKKEKLDKNPIFKLGVYIGNLIRHSLRINGFTKNSKTKDIIGISFEELTKHLNNNIYGFVFGDSDLDIDHIIPLDSATTEEEVYKLNHFTNLQLLPSEYNRHIKINKPFDKIHFEEWYYNKIKN